MGHTCFKDGCENEARRKLEEQINELPRSQADPGRHACPYCAYNLGYKEAWEDLAEHFQEIMRR